MLGNVGKLYGKVGNLLKIRNLFTPLRCCKDEDTRYFPIVRHLHPTQFPNHLIPVKMASKTKDSSDRDLLERILQLVEQYLLHPQSKSDRIYDHKTLMKMLNVNDRYIRRLRDNGYLGFIKHGDKYWYTQADLDRFVQRFHYNDFASDGCIGL